MAYGDDIYQALIGGAPTDPQRQAALAQVLRQQAAQGNILAASGDRVIGPMGEQMTGQANEQAQEVSRERAQEAQARMMLDYRQAQAQNMADKVAATIRGQDVGATSRESVADTAADAKRDVAKITAQSREDVAATKGAKLKPIPEATRRGLDDARNSLAGVDQAIATYKPEYSGTGQNYENALAANVPGLATKNMKAAQNWWANYGRQFTLPELKATIGLRHNQYMQGVFEQYHLNPNMSGDQIPTNLHQIHGQVHDRISRAVTALRDQGYDVSGYKDYLPNGDAGSAATQGPAALRYLHQQKTSTPAYMTPPAAQPQGSVAQPLVRPTPPIAPGGNLFQGLGGLPGG